MEDLHVSRSIQSLMTSNSGYEGQIDIISDGKCRVVIVNKLTYQMSSKSITDMYILD